MTDAQRPPALPPARAYKATGCASVVIHQSRTCPQLSDAGNVRAATMEHWGDADRCSVCFGDGYNPAQVGADGLWQDLDEMDPEDLGLGGGRA